MYVIAGDGSTGTARTTDDPHGGKYSLHFWNAAGIDFTVEQTVTLKPGTYTFATNIQGGDMGDAQSVLAYVVVNGQQIYGEETPLSGWIEWKTPNVSFTVTKEGEVTVGMAVKGAASAWGTLDDWELRMNDPIKYGDANCDGKVGADDASAILRYVVELDTLSELGRINGEVDGLNTQKVSAADAACILRYIVELIKQFPVEL